VGIPQVLCKSWSELSGPFFPIYHRSHLAMRRMRARAEVLRLSDGRPIRAVCFRTTTWCRRSDVLLQMIDGDRKPCNHKGLQWENPRPSHLPRRLV
jgi:hypothetical protein